MKKIVLATDPILREVAKPVPEEMFGSRELARLIADMTKALDAQPYGVGLAAPQIGVSYRLFIARVDRTRKSPPKGAKPRKPEVAVFINPLIVRATGGTKMLDEGCLSLPGIYGDVKRHKRVVLKARDEAGKDFLSDVEGTLAQLFEHEMDHLNGYLFIDRAERLWPQSDTDDDE